VSTDELQDVLSVLGLDKSGQLTNQTKKDQLCKGIRMLMDLHFLKPDNTKRADIMGELLFDSHIFSKESSKKMAAKATRSMASCIFNAVSILRAIDSKAGSLNDSAVDEYAQIEKTSKITQSHKGKGILR
jgi:hypothetical protein